MFILPTVSLNQILQQMKSDSEMLNLEEGAAPIRNPSTAAEDARLASLISLDAILKQVKVSFSSLLLVCCLVDRKNQQDLKSFCFNRI